jgi:hypothetical protein
MGFYVVNAFLSGFIGIIFLSGFIFGILFIIYRNVTFFYFKKGQPSWICRGIFISQLAR